MRKAIINDAVKELKDPLKYSIAKYLKEKESVPFEELFREFGGTRTVAQFDRKLTFMFFEGISDRDEGRNYFLTENGGYALDQVNKLTETQQQQVEYRDAYHYDLDAEKGIVYEGVEYRRRVRGVTPEDQPDMGPTYRTEISAEERQQLVRIFEGVFVEEVPEQQERLRAAE